jgi:subtilase family serine protease
LLLVAGLVPAAPAALPALGNGSLAVPAIAVHPDIQQRLVSADQPGTTASCEQAYGFACYQPSQIQAAYDLAPLFNQGINGAGQTIAIVDAFGSPTIASDLAYFDQTFGLPSPPSLSIIQPAGPVTYNSSSSADQSWAGETTLDVEWAHVMAPGASILLVETPVDETEGPAGFPQIVQAENYVVNNHLADIISQSFAATEETFPASEPVIGFRSAFINAYEQDVTVLGASGDTGATDYSNTAGTLLYTNRVSSWPATDPLVTAVGGTELDLGPSGARLSPDVAWNDTDNTAVLQGFTGSTVPSAIASSGGVSAIFARPAYQNSVANVTGAYRGVPDISMNAACSATVDVYSSALGGWEIVCGTSEATPLFAGIVALADQLAGHSLGLINPALYAMEAAHDPGIVDVTQGDNTVTFTQDKTTYTVQGYPAGAGYDLVTGVGTVDAALFVPELVSTADQLAPPPPGPQVNAIRSYVAKIGRDLELGIPSPAPRR